MINYTYNNIMLAFLIIFVEKTWSWAVQRAIKESNTMISQNIACHSPSKEYYAL